MGKTRRLELAGLIVLYACGSACDSRGTNAAGFSERDSAGVVIAVTAGMHARSPVGWQMDTLPDLEIGSAGSLLREESAASWYTFHRIGGARQLSDGRIVVADQGSSEVRYFDSAGRFMHSLGGQGRGPGEFQTGPVLVSSFRSDSLLFFDARPVRFQLFSTDDDGYRHIRPARWLGAIPPIGFVSSQVLVGQLHLYKPTTTGPFEIPATYAWTDIATGNRVVVDSFIVRPQYATRMVNNIAWGGPIPFSAMPSAAVKHDGAFITHGVLSEIKEYDLRGRLERIVRIDEPPREITEADIRGYAEVTGKPLDPDIPFPDMMPTFESLLVDDEGWLWAKAFGWDPTRRSTWVVFDAGGRAHGSIETPASFKLHQIGSDFVLGVWTNELDVEHVRRYRLTREHG